MEQKFYICNHCGNIIAFAKDKGVPVVCCGEKMSLLTANTTDASQEKHVPAVTREGDKVTVVIGDVIHPMVEEHYIEWISVQTTQGNQRKVLVPGQEPKAEFMLLPGEEVEAVYAYCNLHSLWKK